MSILSVSSARPHPSLVSGMAQFLYLDSTQREVLKAASFVNRHLEGYRREDPDEPEVDHAYRVANVVRNVLLLDKPVYSVVALLHDVLEKTTTEAALVEAVFGTEVVLAVQALTRPEGDGEEAEDAYVAQILEASDVAVAVKMADLMDNLITRIHSDSLEKTVARATHFLEATGDASLSASLRVPRQMLANTIRQVTR